MGQEKHTGEIKDTHKISIWTPERKKHFGRSRARWDGHKELQFQLPSAQ